MLSAVLGAIVYLYFRIDVRPDLERDGHWPASAYSTSRSISSRSALALLPAYWVCWRRPHADDLAQTRAALTLILAAIVWWGFLVGHVLNNIMGFGS